MVRVLLSLLILCSPFAGQCQMKFIASNGETKDLSHVPNKSKRTVKVYTNSNEIPAGAVRIGMLTNSTSDVSASISEARELAARAGGDGIISYHKPANKSAEDIMMLSALGLYQQAYGFVIYGHGGR